METQNLGSRDPNSPRIDAHVSEYILSFDQALLRDKIWLPQLNDTLSIVTS